jgi:hypothetical protein
MDMELSRWPIDYDSLQKGSTIPAAHLERITGKSRNSSDYALALLKLKNRIESELVSRSKDWTLRVHKGEIKVCTDAEAATFNHREQERARSAQQRRHMLQLAVDVTELTPDQRLDHERNCEVDGKYVQAMRETRKTLTHRGHKRTTPALASAN